MYLDRASPDLDSQFPFFVVHTAFPFPFWERRVFSFLFTQTHQPPNLLINFRLAKRISQATEMTPDVHMFLMHAILLRIQSGSDCRHCDLARIEWAHVEKHEYVVGLDECTFSVKITPSKITFTQDATPLEYFASDDITATLFSHWHDLHSTAGKWFFPRVLKGNRFDFSLQMKPETHTQACQMCAEVLGLQVSTQFKSALGANAVRRGNAATVGIAIKGVDASCDRFLYILHSWSYWYKDSDVTNRDPNARVFGRPFAISKLLFLQSSCFAIRYHFVSMDIVPRAQMNRRQCCDIILVALYA